MKETVNHEWFSQHARLARINARMNDSNKQPKSEGVFISYRREDAGYAGRIYDWLQESFPKRDLFMDVDAIAKGSDYMEVINEAINSAAVLIVLIGPRWLDVANGKENRLEDADDVVRHEISVGLQRNIFILPILLGKASMPSSKVLPADLKDFSRKNAHEISDLRWAEDTNQMIEALKKVLIKPDPPEPGEAEQLIEILVQVADFAEDTDPEMNAGDFLTVGAGKGNVTEGAPYRGIDVFRNNEVAWCELACELYSWNRGKVMNQISKLEENGWVAPLEGPYKKSFFRGMKLNRWWRNLDKQNPTDDFTNISIAVLKTFVDIYDIRPKYVNPGWSSEPYRHPLEKAKDTSEKGVEVGMATRTKL